MINCAARMEIGFFGSGTDIRFNSIIHSRFVLIRLLCCIHGRATNDRRKINTNHGCAVKTIRLDYSDCTDSPAEYLTPADRIIRTTVTRRAAIVLLLHGIIAIIVPTRPPSVFTSSTVLWYANPLVPRKIRNNTPPNGCRWGGGARSHSNRESLKYSALARGDCRVRFRKITSVTSPVRQHL